MKPENVYSMKFSKVYPMIVAKAQRKDHTREEVNILTSWLTGYTSEEIDAATAPESEVTYGDFFRNAPKPNPNREKITGSVCGVKLGEIKAPLMLEIRRLDKLVDELYKGKAMEKILRT